ncbi:DPY30 domain containing 2, partial [Pseudorasbora parva]|uniref:DPY30 domain containing 2 n=1 Tax=Pseudorasbora parva TaxID=51549 RepID=UPI00351ED464
MDSQYVSRTLGRCLSEGLAELIELRPLDPIEFLALWIRKYYHNQKLELQKAAHQKELEEEQRRVHEDTLHQQTLLEEQKQIRAVQHDPESANLLQQREDDEPTETAADPANHKESEIEPNDQVIEPNDQVIEPNDQVIEPNDQVIEEE